ncbi:MAG TPA: MFS transporter [Candidatus Dormibacteraeota bacterium]|nr:MFS transporter [Candidatus Dormibacteraeota bacterium]
MTPRGFLARLRHLAVDLTPLRESRDFRLLWSGQLISMVGRQITTVALPFQVFQMTGSSLAVGTLGLVQLVPYIVMSLAGGSLADSYDRRKLLLGTQVGLAATSGLLALGAFGGRPALLFVYAVAGLASAISAIDLPARAATTPNLVPPRRLAAALSLNFALFQVTLVAGPAVGGLIIARFGLGWGYLIDVATFGASIAAVLLLRPQRPVGARREPPLLAIGRGLRFVGERQPILGCFVADLDAMILAWPRALFPVIALQGYHAGAAGLGLLFAAPGVGSVVASLLSGFVGGLRHQGRAVLISVAVWGLGIALFGLTTFSLPLGLACLALAGAADAISAIARGTIIQTITPDRLRGRLSATNSMVVVGGPYLGDFRGGAMASLIGPGTALVAGGVLCVAVCGLIAALLPRLRDYDSTAPPVAAPDG